MLTSRGWWFLVLTLTIGAIGGVLALRGAASLLLVSVCLLTWMGVEGVLFTYRTRLVARRLSVSRTILDERGPVRTLWAGKDYRVEVGVALPGGRLPFAVLVDRPPAGAEALAENRFEGGFSGGDVARWEYAIRPAEMGVVRFEGVRLRMADLQGFFYAEAFLRAPVELPVLPVVNERSEPRRADKRFNLLPPPGVHRHRRPGTGSELLELRDYRPGDPPRRIAWKVSARRDILVTREYESEVPLRCTLIVDGSNATRLGPPGRTPLASLTAVTAAVSQAAIGNRDLIGLTVCTGDEVSVLTPARTARQLVGIFEALARAAPLAPRVAGAAVRGLLPRAYAVASDLYPELMNPRLNRFPLWLAWVSPALAETWWRRWRRVFSSTHRHRQAQRKRLAAMLTAQYALPPGATAILTDVDSAMALWLQHFLAEHRVPYEVAVYGPRGVDLFADPAPLRQQAAALTAAVGRGRDNELFVLLGEYASRTESLDPILQAVRVARARRHQVLVVQPGRRPPDEVGPPPLTGSAEELRAYAATARAARAWHDLRRAFGKLGVPVIPAGDGDPARLILHRLEQLRLAQGARP